MSKALVVVDVQRDFCEGGSLGVAGGNEVAHRVADYILSNGGEYDEIVFTKDYHNAPPDDNGGHFALEGEPDYVNTWPVHCVAGTAGSELQPALVDLAAGRPVFRKGQGRPDYSGFQGTDDGGIGLASWLRGRNVQELDVVGIAGDHCVRATALDGVANNFKVVVLKEMVASVGGDEATEAALIEIFNTQMGVK